MAEETGTAYRGATLAGGGVHDRAICDATIWCRASRVVAEHTSVHAHRGATLTRGGVGAVRARWRVPAQAFAFVRTTRERTLVCIEEQLTIPEDASSWIVGPINRLGTRITQF